MGARERAIGLLRRYRSDLMGIPWEDRRELFRLAGDGIDLCEWYGEEPLRFGREVLGEEYSEDVARFIGALSESEVVFGRSATGVGKTHGVGMAVVWHALCRPASQTWACAAPPEGNLVNILWPQIERRYHGHRYLWDARGWEMKTLELRRSWRKEDGIRGSDAERPMVIGVRIPQSGSPKQRESRFSGKHAKNLMFVVDEGDAVPEEVYRGIDGCMSGGRVRLVVTFNPREQCGPLWERERNGTARVVHLSALRHPNVVRGKDVFPGAVTRQITVRRIQEWTEPTTHRSGEDPTVFAVPDELIGVVATRSKGGMHPALGAGYRRIINHEFAYKVLGIYSPIGTFAQVFDRAYLVGWEERLDAGPGPLRVIETGEGLGGHCEVYEEPIERAEYVIAADPAEGKDPERSDYCEAIVLNAGTWAEAAHYWSRCDPHTFAGDLAALGTHYGGAELIVERNNHGATVIEALLHEHEYPSLYMDGDEEYGALTTVKSKAARVDGVRGMLTAMRRGAEKGIEFRSLRTIQQMMSFGRLGNHRMGGLYGANDDAVTCITMAHRVLADRVEYRRGRIELPDPMVLYGARR